MKLNLNQSPEDQAKVEEILRAMGSKNKTESQEAQECFAKFVGPTIAQVLDQVASSAQVFQKFTYNEDESPSIPLDLFEGNTEGLITVWSESIAGGLATNHISGMDDFRFTVEDLTSAVSCGVRYAKEARMDVITLMIKKMLQELLLKSEYLNWATLLASLANSRTGPGGLAQVYAGATAGIFRLADLNTLWTKVSRLRSSWAGGTPVSSPGRGLTHLIISPEVQGDIRSIAFNPVNNLSTPNQDESTAMPATDALRNEVFKAGGATSLFGVTLITLNELGVGQAYNGILDNLYSPVGSETTFDATTQEAVIGLDLSIPAFLEIVEKGDDGSVTVIPDDQWAKRSQKIGFYASRRAGRIALDSKAAVCVII